MESIGRLTACGAPVDLALRQEIGDSDGRRRRGERHDRGVGAQRFDRRVAPVPACRARARRLTMDLQYAVVEVENPVVPDSRAGICRGLPSAREGQARLRDLDDERRTSRVRGGVVTWRAANDADIRLGLGPVIEDDRALSLNEPALSESALQRLRQEENRRPIRAVPWLRY